MLSEFEVPTMIHVIPDSILDEFNGSGEPELMHGGQGQTYRVGNCVLKPCSDAAEMEGLSEVMRIVEQAGFRIARPVM